MWTTHPGEAKGDLSLRFSGLMQAEEVLRFHPEIQAQLDEIARQGWKYLYIVISGTAVTEVPIENQPCRIRMSTLYGGRSAPPPTVLEVTLRQQTPELKDVPEVQEFRINVCSKSFPRAAVVDLSKGLVTYIHDPFWKWDKQWTDDAQKLSDAKEVYEIARWLVEVKKYSLAEPLQLSRYSELADQFKALK
jgi:hypothetical protein